jgi:ubiquinone/menaquinone biosynthesis C-methylase UbiE
MGDMTEPTIGADTYARWRASTLGRITERVEMGVVLGLAGQLAGKRVLDVGTGDGTYALEAAARGAFVTGIDLDPNMLTAARTRANERGLSATFETGRAEALPFAAGTFDVVLAVTVLCLVSDARIAAREMARVLAPGGRLVIGELGRYSIWAAERRVRGWLGARTWRHARFWSRRALVGLVEAAGLRVAVVGGSIFFPPSGFAARVVSPFEPLLTRLHAPGAAFLVVAGDQRD